MRINGDSVVAMGRGDYHERTYDSMRRVASFETVTNIDDGTKYGLPFNKDHCMVQMEVYPSDTFYKIFNTETPAIVTAAVAVVFMISVVLFFVYDYLVQTRQNMVMDRAHKTQKLVTSLFPEDVAERMMDHAAKDSAEKKKNGKNVFLNANQAFTGMLSEDQMRDQEDDTPIADLFPFCTVLFCDISGFTAWSSAREPAQVFILLQTIYEAFDRVAKRRKVFKVETIGDSYVAVTGLPEPQKNHAVIMTRFAGECLTKMQELVQLLEPRLGPDTADLDMRFGLHSGQVTAGVLRGAKSRFQLFGDTVNTASRMESTGIPGRIQVSESTYKYLMEAGKDKWLKARTDNVKAKGKGSLKTWWVNPCVKRASSVSGSSATGSATEVSTDINTLVVKTHAQIMADKFKKQLDLDAKDRRLVTWICDLLHEQIQKVMVMRQSAAKTSGLAEVKDISWHKNETTGANTMDEVKDALITPTFCQKAYDDQVGRMVTKIVCKLFGCFLSSDLAEPKSIITYGLVSTSCTNRLCAISFYYAQQFCPKTLARNSYPNL